MRAEKVRLPSRLMPKREFPKKIGGLGGALFLILLIAFISALPAAAVLAMGAPPFLAGLIAAGCFFAHLGFTVYDRKKAEKLAAERREETICSFARQLDCREIDTWIIRAVYEEMLEYFGYPPHLDDSFEKIDPDDVEDMAIAIAERIGRPLKDGKNNPYQGKVGTVRDMVLFFTAQPLEETLVLNKSSNEASI
jgi:hypothetical protein